MKHLRIQLQNIQDKIRRLEKEKYTILNKIQNEKCEHNRIEKAGGGVWREWPNYDYYEEWYECLDCGKRF